MRFAKPKTADVLRFPDLFLPEPIEKIFGTCDVKPFLDIQIARSGTVGATNVDMQRRDFLKRSTTAALALTGLGAVRATPSLAADYPTLPIRVIVPFPAGGAADVVSGGDQCGREAARDGRDADHPGPPIRAAAARTGAQLRRVADAIRGLSVREALVHAGLFHARDVDIEWVQSEGLERDDVHERLKNADGIIVPGGFGYAPTWS